MAARSWRAARIHVTYECRRNTITRWSHMPLSRYGTATPYRSIRRVRVLPWAKGASPDYSASRRRTFTIRSPFLGGGFGSKGLFGSRRSLGSWPPAWSATGRAGAAPRANVGPVGHRAPTRQRCASARIAAAICGDRPSHQDLVEHVRRFLRAFFRHFTRCYANPAISTSHEAVRSTRVRRFHAGAR